MGKNELVRVGPDNVAKTGFFCKMSARGKPGYEQKLAWLDKRFAEGLEILMLGDGERGFIETIPGDYAWRAIENAGDYLVIHCLWVVGRSKGKGFGKQLIAGAIERARQLGMKGVAAVTSSGNWLVDPKVLAKAGFEEIASDGPFALQVMKVDRSSGDPRFCGGFEEKQKSAGPGLTIFRTGQCPYLDDSTLAARAWAEGEGIKSREVWLESAADVREKSPTPYGVYAMVLDGKLMSYHYLLPKEYAKAKEKAQSG